MLPLCTASLASETCDLSAKVFRDPHINFAFGGSADLRGHHNALYNFLSAPGFSVNVKTEAAVFKMHGGALTINGTFLTEAHITTQLSPQKLATASYWASELDPNNFGWSVVNGTCVGRPFRFGLHGHKACFDFKMSMDHSSATFELGNWTVKVHGSRSCKGCLVAGPEHRLDIGFTARGDAPARDKPHGIVGQSYATPGLERHGKKDLYPFSGSYTTSAQAEGAIEGSASDYQVASPYATGFAFSRFNAARGAPASAEPTGGVDASSIDRIADPATEAERRRLSEAPCPPSAAGVAASPPPSPQSPPPAKPACPYPSYTRKSGHSWTAAKASCEADGMHLAVPENPEQDDAIAKVCAGEWCWIGGQNPSGSTIAWVNNAASTYTNWQANEPNSEEAEKCIVILRNGQWNDGECHEAGNYVCQCHAR
jgi:hypothetical protein